MTDTTCLTADELSARIKYDVRTIRGRLKDSVLLEGIHYIRPFDCVRSRSRRPTRTS